METHFEVTDSETAGERELGSVTVMDISEALFIQKPVLDADTVIVVTTMQAFRRDDKEGLKVYKSSGNLMGHFQGVPDEILRNVARNDDGTISFSLANVFRVRKPILVIDEAHNARTPLTFETLARLGPSCILELTATPNITDAEENPRSNILYSVSAAELKAEDMIKLPIRLKTRPNWKELLGEAIGLRNGLEKSADAERVATGEYVRPIMLLQAQPRSKERQTITVETVEKCLLEDFKIPAKHIARATGEDRGLDGVEVLSKDCELRYIITVQALKEGWDCPFAYVLFSVAESKSGTAVEQILGRVMRLPEARKKTKTELNFAYAFAASASFTEAANAIKDGLVENGFERQEANDLVAPLGEQDFGELELTQFTGPTEASVTEPPTTPIPEKLAGKVEFNAEKRTLEIKQALTPDEETALKDCFKSDESKKAIVRASERARVKAKEKSPSQRGEPFCIPVLAIKQGDFLEQFEKTHIDDVGWDLKPCAPALSGGEFNITEAPQTGEVDISDKGKLELHFLPELEKQMTLLSVDAGWPIARLVNWLERSFYHPDIPATDAGVFLTGLVMLLADKRGLSLEKLTAHRYKLSQAVQRRIESYRKQAQAEVFKGFVLGDNRLVVSKEAMFKFPPDAYPCNTSYPASRHFTKHYYPLVGEMKNEGEEFECAKFIDSLPEVKFWLRNLPGPGRESVSFWLQTATDKFYPDFVCELQDRRQLVVEYKNEKDWSNDDNKEKRNLGELWAERSGGACLFIMPKGPDFGAVLRLLKSTKGAV